MMRLALSLLFVAAAVTRTLAVAAYDDLVLTSIDVKPVGNSSKRVEFSGKIPGDLNDTDAVFLKNVTRVRWEGMFGFRTPVFQADRVSLEEAKKTIRKSHKKNTTNLLSRAVSSYDGKPLLCIHGFNVQPEDHLKECLAAKDKFKEFKLIPVIWPSKGGIMNYFSDRRKASIGAGKAFKSLTEVAKRFPRKSLIAHSMGNRVLRYGADDKFKFDNIFMVAADVNGNMFNKDYIEGGTDDNEEDDEEGRHKDGLTLKNMLNPKGKIHVLHNNQDYALTGSTITKLGVPRLGSITLKDDKLHEQVRDKIEEKNAGGWLNWTPRFASHGYQWDTEAVSYYESKFF